METQFFTVFFYLKKTTKSYCSAANCNRYKKLIFLDYPNFHTFPLSFKCRFPDCPIPPISLYFERYYLTCYLALDIAETLSIWALSDNQSINQYVQRLYCNSGHLGFQISTKKWQGSLYLIKFVLSEKKYAIISL